MTARPDRATGALRGWMVPAAVVLLGPILVVLVLRLPLINQLEYADAWFYSGYAWVPTHHFAAYDWTYFSVRFPVILPIAAFDRVLGEHLGYVVLRYLLAAGTGLALYLGVRRFARSGVAVAAVVLLYLNPFFSRMLLWDYAGFMLIAAGVSGVALWYWTEPRGRAWTLLPGATLAAAAFANLVMILPLAVLFGVEALAALRTGREAAREFAIRCLLCGIAGLGVFVIGWLSYLALLGDVSPGDLLAPTFDFVGNNSENAGLYQQDIGEWLLAVPRVIAPIALSAALVVAMGRSVLGTDVRARVAQGCIGLTVGLWVYRLGVTSSVIETWWAFSIIVMFMAPATGVLLATLEEADEGTRRVKVGVAVAAAMIAAIVIRNGGGVATDAYAWIIDHGLVVIALLVIAVGLAVAISRSGRWTVAALAAFLVMLQLLTYAPDALDGRGGTGVFVRDGDREWDAYAAGKRVAQIISSRDDVNRNVTIWYPGDTGLVRIAWVDLLQFGQTLNVPGKPERVTTLTPFAAERLKLPLNAYVLVLSPERQDMARSRAALAAAGFGGPIVEAGSLADGGLYYQLIDLQKQPATGA